MRVDELPVIASFSHNHRPLPSKARRALVCWPLYVRRLEHIILLITCARFSASAYIALGSIINAPRSRTAANHLVYGYHPGSSVLIPDIGEKKRYTLPWYTFLPEWIPNTATPRVISPPTILDIGRRMGAPLSPGSA